MWRVLVSTLLLQLVIHSAYGIAPMIGVDCNKKLVQRSSMLGKWEKVGGSCCVNSIGILHDHSLLGVKDDRQVYRKESPHVGDWVGPLPDSCCVKDVTVMSDGTLLGVSTEGLLVTRPDPRTTTSSAWTDVRRSKGVVAADVHPDGRIFGVTKEGLLKVRDGLDGTWATFKTEGLGVRDIAIQKNGLIFGIGKRSKALHVLDGQGKWGLAIPDTECIESIASASNLSQ